MKVPGTFWSKRERDKVKRALRRKLKAAKVADGMIIGYHRFACTREPIR